MQWQSINDSQWILLDQQIGQLISDSPGGAKTYNLTHSWISLTNDTVGARAYKFVVEQTRGTADLGTQAGCEKK